MLELTISEAGLLRISRVTVGVDIICRRRAEAGNLHYNGLVPCFSKMSLAWRFCIKASCREALAVSFFVEAISVSDSPRTGNHSCNDGRRDESVLQSACAREREA